MKTNCIYYRTLLVFVATVFIIASLAIINEFYPPPPEEIMPDKELSKQPEMYLKCYPDQLDPFIDVTVLAPPETERVELELRTADFHFLEEMDIVEEGVFKRLVVIELPDPDQQTVRGMVTAKVYVRGKDEYNYESESVPVTLTNSFVWGRTTGYAIDLDLGNLALTIEEGYYGSAVLSYDQRYGQDCLIEDKEWGMVSKPVNVVCEDTEMYARLVYDPLVFESPEGNGLPSWIYPETITMATCRHGEDEDKNWERMRSDLDMENRVVHARINKPGVYVLAGKYVDPKEWLETSIEGGLQELGLAKEVIQ